MKLLLVNTKKLNLRNQPNRESSIIGLLNGGERVKVISFSSEYYWTRIERANGQTGWACFKYFLGIPDDNFVRNNDYKWLKIAFGEINTAELSDPKENRRITQYLKTCELSLDKMNENSDETPWCSAFANWCIEKSGFQGTNDALAKSWLTWGNSASARRGVLAVFKRYYIDRNDNKKIGGHVGFYLRKDSERPNRILVLGGNQGNPGFVKISSYPIKRSKNSFEGYELQGFRKPYTTQIEVV